MYILKNAIPAYKVMSTFLLSIRYIKILCELQFLCKVGTVLEFNGIRQVTKLYCQMKMKHEMYFIVKIISCSLSATQSIRILSKSQPLMGVLDYQICFVYCSCSGTCITSILQCNRIVSIPC